MLKKKLIFLVVITFYFKILLIISWVWLVAELLLLLAKGMAFNWWSLYSCIISFTLMVIFRKLLLIECRKN